MANRVLGTPLEKKVLDLYLKQGMTAKEVAAAVGCSDATVCKVLHKHGHRQRSYGGRGGKYKLPVVERERAVALYLAGASCEQVASDFGVTAGAVTRWVRDMGFSVRPAGFQKGEAHHDWKGGVIPNPDGYLLERVDESDPLFAMGQKKAGSARYALQHRLVMARHLGRPLAAHETVHHIDGDIQNNAIENLQLRNGKHGSGVALCCADCGSHNIIEQELH